MHTNNHRQSGDTGSARLKKNKAHGAINTAGLNTDPNVANFAITQRNSPPAIPAVMRPPSFPTPEPSYGHDCLQCQVRERLRTIAWRCAGWLRLLSPGVAAYPASVRHNFAGAVAAAVLHDAKVNLFGRSGVLPQITLDGITDDDGVDLDVALRVDDVAVCFKLPRTDARRAAHRFKTSGLHDAAIFEPVQKALAELEFKVMQAGRAGNSK